MSYKLILFSNCKRILWCTRYHLTVVIFILIMIYNIIWHHRRHRTYTTVRYAAADFRRIAGRKRILLLYT